jgi:N-methylhydantoinase B
MPRHRRSSARGSVPERSLSDPILLELVKNALDTIVDEMAIALVRTGLLEQSQERDGHVLRPLRRGGPAHRPGPHAAAAPGLHPRRDGPDAKKFAGRIDPGDVFILNDPFEGGTHLPDFYIFKPIFLGKALVGWAASIGHQLDVGGKTPGGNGCDATEIYQEGLRIPAVKLYARGEPSSRSSR